MKYLKSKIVIITGASSGIGFNLSKILITKYDCKVIGIARNQDKLEKAHKQLGDNFIPFSSDCSKEDGWRNIADFIKSSNYLPQILINNAGMMLPFEKSTNVATDDYKKIIDTNLMSVIYSVNYVVPILSGEKGLVNISSSSSLCPVIGQSGYAATKSAVKSFTEVLSTEVDFYVGIMMPGFCKTDIMSRIEMNEKEKSVINKIAMPAEKCAEKILKAVNRKVKRKIIGADAVAMNLLYKLFPKKAGLIIAAFLKKSKFPMFEKLQ